MERNTMIAFVLLSGLFIATTLHYVLAAPTGASILTNSTAGTPASSPDSRADARGTITTLLLDSLQQNQNWKAYVGNVTGRLSLDDADSFTIYDWTISGSVTGEVYVTRTSSPDWNNVSCATEVNVTSEHPVYNMTNSQQDSINLTFNATSHDAFLVGTISITADTCKSTATYINDTEQEINGNQTFQELILQDSGYNLIYVTIIDDNTLGYRNDTNYDFQMIVPENDINATPTTYYFFTEIAG